MILFLSMHLLNVSGLMSRSREISAYLCPLQAFFRRSIISSVTFGCDGDGLGDGIGDGGGDGGIGIGSGIGVGMISSFFCFSLWRKQNSHCMFSLY